MRDIIIITAGAKANYRGFLEGEYGISFSEGFM